MTFPLNPNVGQQFRGWFWNGCAWVPCIPAGCCQHCGCSPCQCGCDRDPCQPGSGTGGAPVITGPVAPSNPNPGTLWFDGTTLWIYTGSAWDPLAVAGSAGGGGGGTSTGSNPPANPGLGQQWWDGTQLWLWNGTSWIAIGPGGGGTVSNPNVYSVVSFLTPGNFTFQVPSDVVANTTWMFHLCGGGGGGGGCDVAAAWAGQGGGGGQYRRFAVVGLQAGLLVSCQVGAAGTGGGPGLDGVWGGDSSVIIANTNTTIIAKGGGGGWGSQEGNNFQGEGLGGKNGTFNAGTTNVMSVLDLPGGDAHFGVSTGDPAVGGASSFLGQGAPSFNTDSGWNDTTAARGFGAGGRGAWAGGTPGTNGTQGAMIIERDRD